MEKRLRPWRILKGMINYVIKPAKVEIVSRQRTKICMSCLEVDKKGDKCFASGTQPCCGICGCSLKFKTRVLEERCPATNPKW